MFLKKKIKDQPLTAEQKEAKKKKSDTRVAWQMLKMGEAFDKPSLTLHCSRPKAGSVLVWVHLLLPGLEWVPLWG